jgi:hypothetical protein
LHHNKTKGDKIMMFNNKFNSDGTIHFDVNEWVNTDPDEGQFCRKISDTEFEYIQLKDMDGKEHSKHLLEALNDKTHISDWYQEIIDVNDYSNREIEEYVAPYGEILDGSEGAYRNQLIAECIFETDYTFNGWYE